MQVPSQVNLQSPSMQVISLRILRAGCADIILTGKAKRGP
jgi:hypothetical protein